MIFSTNGLNYQKWFWRFWFAHRFETNKHKFKLYFLWNDEFLGAW